MRILPQVSQPTLDSFRKDVYRPRLALLLLILLLGGKKPASSNWLSEINKVSASAIDDTTLEPLPSAASTSFLSLDRLRAPFISNTKQADQAKQGKSRKVKQTSSMGKGQKSKVDAAQSNSKSTDDLSTVSALRIPRLGLQLLLRGQALSAIVPLHILWIVRLAGMVVEDSIVKRLHSQQIITSHSTVFIKIALLAISALGSLFLTSSSNLDTAMSILSLGWFNPRSHKDDADGSLSLPFRMIVLLELSATLLSLLSPLMKLNSPHLSRILPRDTLLPSPSHSPAVTDMLPLPPGLAEVLSGRASDMQTRAGRRGAATLRRESVAGVRRHGAIAAPLTLPAQGSATSGRTTGKAPRVKGLQVQVDSSWLLENVIILWGYLVGSIEYLLVALTLPTLSPTSFPPILALLSLRSQLSALVLTWTSARKSVECLEFVRRRWAPSSSRTRPRWTPEEQEDILCPVCLEQIQWQSKDKDDSPNVNVESCRLDCGHELHAVCLVQIFIGTRQAFCPCCHHALKATPPEAIPLTPAGPMIAPLVDVVQE